MRKKLAFIAFVVITAVFVLSPVASKTMALTETFDGTTNYAVSKNYWADDAFADKTVFDGNGITYKDWGEAYNWAGNSLKSLLTKDTTVELDFNISASGATKLMLTLDATGARNGKALKPWEIDGQKEYLALEVSSSGVFLYQYNKNNVYGEHNQLTVTEAVQNYLNGTAHKLNFSFAPSEDGTGMYVKIIVDSTTHFDAVIPSTVLYNINPVLTIGLGNEHASGDTANISSIKIIDNGSEGVVEKEPTGILMDSGDWNINDAVTDELTISEDKGSVVVTGYKKGNYGMTYKNALPFEYSLNFTLLCEDASQATNQDAGIRLVLLETAKTTDGSAVQFSDKAGSMVFVQIDANNNMWLFHTKDGSIVKAPGIANTGLAGGIDNKITITAEIDYEYSCITYSVFINGVKKGGIDVEDISILGSNYLTIGGSNDNGVYNAAWTVSDLIIEDSIKFISGDVLGQPGLDVTGYEYQDGTLTGADGAAHFATGAVIKNGEPFSFKFKVSATWENNYYYLSVSNYQASAWNNDLAEGLATLWWESFNTIKYFDNADNSTGTWKANPSLGAVMVDGEEHTLAYSFITADDAYKLVLSVDSTAKAEIDLKGTPLESAEYLVVSGRQTGGGGHAIISDFTAPTPEAQQVFELRQYIYSIPLAIDAGNAEDTQQMLVQAESLYQALSENGKAQVANYAYLQFVSLAVEEYEAALLQQQAQVVIDEIAAIEYQSITAENLQQVKDAVDAAKTSYDALDEQAKALVSNYGRIAEIEEYISDYEAEAARIETLKVQAKAVDTAIDDISYESITAENVQEIKQAVANAKALYSALSEEGKAFVEKYSKIAQIESDITAFESKSGGGCKGYAAEEWIVALAAIMVLAAAVAIRKRAQIND